MYILSAIILGKKFARGLVIYQVFVARAKLQFVSYR